ncbi:MAG: hypothetical protein JXX29_04465 [Deltaproteobacteria bacterium]|nr:hypothetical protein [Deltaproteobacteria bacterium]MBN2670898.1 hypothetical protein [Deltaproteobacteria bacterium]
MIRFYTYLLSFILTALCVSACFPAEEFSDVPENLNERTANFEKIASLLVDIKSADETNVAQYTKHNDRRIRRAAALRLLTLGTISSSSIHALGQLLQHDPDARVRTAAARALGESAEGPQASAVVQALCDKNANVRLYALKSLIHMESRANEAIAHYLAESEDSNVRCPTITTENHTLRDELLRQIEINGAKFLPALAHSLTHSNRAVVSSALDMLIKLGRGATMALPNVTALMNNPAADLEIRNKCIDVVATVGDQHPTVMPALYAAKNDSAPRIRSAAENAIRRIQAQNTRPQPMPGRPQRGPIPRGPMRPVSR